MYRKIFPTKQFALMSALMAAFALLLAGCHPEDVTDRVPLNMASPAGSQLQSGDEQGANVMMRVPAYDPGDLFVPGTGSGDDVSKVANYLPYNKLYPTPINKTYTTIGAFLAQDTKNSYESLAGFFQWKDANSWSTTVGIRPGEFYIFGYMPSNVGSVSARIDKLEAGDVDYALSSPVSWADGAKMTISNLSTVTPADVCVVVGVKKADVPDPKPDPWVPSPIDNANVVRELKQGQYAYHGTENDNYVYLLLDHLYTNVNMELSVEEKYAELRTIVLTSVFMKTPVRETVNAVITLTNSPTKPIKDIQFTAPTGDQPTKAQIFPALPEYQQVVSSNAAEPTSIPGYFAPGMTTQSFEFEFHYDVYDKEGEDLSDPENPIFGNCVRKNCVAINKWTLPGTGVQNGKSFKVTATIRPTYLYMLSDPDLDNPTVELNSVTN